jgi:membrane fusion protein, multidrug efflux system
LDARRTERSPSAEKPRLPATRPEQLPPPQDRKPNEKPQDKAKPSPSLRERFREHWLLATVATCVLLVAAIGGLAYWLSVRDYESTDDAFVAARSFSVAPKVGGYVTEVPVTDNQHVNAGDLLAGIDDRDYITAVDQTRAQVAVAQANIGNIQAQIDSRHQQIDQAKAQVDQAEAQLQFAQQEEARAKDLVDKGAGTVQREQQTRSDLQSQQANEIRTKAAFVAAQLGVKTLEAQLQSARAQLRQAQAQLDQANLNLRYTRVTAAGPRCETLRRGRHLCDRGPKPDDVRAGRGLGRRQLQGDPA